MIYAVEVNSLFKSYGKKPVLENMSMKVRKKSIYGFLGINGAGKTTTFGILSGFLPAEDGDFKIGGKLAVLPQDSSFYPERTVESQLGFFARLSAVPSKKAKEEVARVLELVGLEKEKKAKAGTLSHGMTNKLALAQAMLGDPDILLLDEPTSGLDPKNVVEIRNLIIELGKDRTVIISSHILSEISEMCDDVGILHNGKLVFEGPMSEITKSGNSLSFKLSSAVDLSILDHNRNITGKVYDHERNLLSVTFEPEKTKAEQVNHEVMKAVYNAGSGIMEIKKGNSLEESFLNLLK